MQSDNCGFPYPRVDERFCTSCEQCVEVCPVLTGIGEGIDDIQKLKVYAAFSKDEHIRERSSSGGLFSELALPILQQGGLVVGARFSDPYTVEHSIIDCINDLEQLRKSKYVQSEIGIVFRIIKEYLIAGRTVLFSGTPCQAAGLHCYLGESYDNLIIIDLICHSINSPKAYVYWIKDVEIEFGKRVVQVEFRHKINGWRKSGWRTKIFFEDGDSTVISKTEGTFAGGFMERLFARPSCSECKFKGKNRVSDITIADFWGIPPELNDDKGMSQVIINSSKGARLFDLIQSRIVCYERSYAEVLEKNSKYAQSVTTNPNSEVFLCSLGKETFSQLMKKYFPFP